MTIVATTPDRSTVLTTGQTAVAVMFTEVSVSRLVEGVRGSISVSKCGSVNRRLVPHEHLGIFEVLFLWIKRMLRGNNDVIARISFERSITIKLNYDQGKLHSG